jgi:hypothetical protein
LILSDGAASQFKNNKNITNLLYHYQDFSLEAAWTFSSSGHGKGPCDGLGAVVKSAARKYLLKQGPEGSFSTAKEFYLFTREKVSQTASASRKVTDQFVACLFVAINSSQPIRRTINSSHIN